MKSSKVELVKKLSLQMLNPYTIKVQQKICSKKTETFLETHALGKLFLVEFKPFRKKFFFKIKLETFIQKMI